MSDKDISDLVEADARKVRQIGGGTARPSIPKLLEGILWGFAILSVIGLLAMMPWVGHGKPIPGTVWLGSSLLGICVFGGLALLVRAVFSPSAERYDRHVDERLQRRRKR